MLLGGTAAWQGLDSTNGGWMEVGARVCWSNLWFTAVGWDARDCGRRSMEMGQLLRCEVVVGGRHGCWLEGCVMM